MRRLNIGCGPYPMPEWVNIDKNPRWVGVDVLRDVRRGLPYDDASVDEIRSSHFMEHLTCEEMIDLLEECWRVLRKDCTLTIVVPIMDFSAPDHMQHFAADSFDIFGRDGGDYFNRSFSWTMVSREIGSSPRTNELTVVLRR